MDDFQLTEDELGAEVTRYYVDELGRPLRARVMYWRAGEGEKGAVTLPGAPAGTWWVSDTDVAESARITSQEYEELAEQAAKDARREAAAAEAAREREAADAEAARERAKNELTGIGLSEETVQLLMKGLMP